MRFDEMHLDDPERLAAAIDDLLVRKPHLASRRPTVTSDKGRHSRQLPSTSLPYYGRERNNSRLANSLARQWFSETGSRRLGLPDSSADNGFGEETMSRALSLWTAPHNNEFNQAKLGGPDEVRGVDDLPAERLCSRK